MYQDILTEQTSWGVKLRENLYFNWIHPIDLITTCINNRFDQSGYKIYHNIEDLLLKAANTENYDEELKFVIQFYCSDFDGYLLKLNSA